MWRLLGDSQEFDVLSLRSLFVCLFVSRNGHSSKEVVNCVQ